MSAPMTQAQMKAACAMSIDQISGSPTARASAPMNTSADVTAKNSMPRPISARRNMA